MGSFLLVSTSIQYKKCGLKFARLKIKHWYKQYLRITKLSQNMGVYKLLVKGAKQVVTVRNDGNIRVLRGKEMQHVDIIDAKGEDGISILVDRWDF